MMDRTMEEWADLLAAHLESTMFAMAVVSPGSEPIESVRALVGYRRAKAEGLIRP